MTTSATVEQAGHVHTVHLTDGKIVQLSGALGPEELAGLRRALLVPLDGDYRDVVVDAGQVTDVTDEAVAILVAARYWIEDNGARFRLSCSAPALDKLLADLDLADELPTLTALTALTADH